MVLNRPIMCNKTNPPTIYVMNGCRIVNIYTEHSGESESSTYPPGLDMGSFRSQDVFIIKCRRRDVCYLITWRTEAQNIPSCNRGLDMLDVH